MIEILDVLRRYIANDSIRAIPEETGIARNTCRNFYQEAADKDSQKRPTSILNLVRTKCLTKSASMTTLTISISGIAFCRSTRKAWRNGFNVNDSPSPKVISSRFRRA